MRIAVTGGTGYVGAHTVRALLGAGHAVRLLVVPGGVDDAVIAALRGLGPLEVLPGDIRNPATISALLTGCDAVLHAAGVVGTDSRRTQLMWEINAYATEALLTQATELGLDPIVSVSSYSSLFPPSDGVIGPDTPPAPGRSDYARTKAYADLAARRLQAQGAPIVVTYPSSVVGPAFHTAVGVTQRGWDPIVRFRVAPRLRGGMQMIDVGDVARVHTALMQPGRGPKRYVCGGVMLTFDQMVDALESALGRPIRRIPLSPSLFRGVGRVSDFAGQWLPLAEGLSYEAALLLTAAVPTDDTSTLADLGLTWRDPRESIADSFA
ncbi:NAD-dependent epimerase/dehydratase family protein [Mycobacterium sp. CBMA293]|uniref:NAD-dependent epimerase/dehydratase family protein n=1 Tax=unclassified Mycolicibacterium TaxID=2636767 RepID=UPI0012DD0F4D|nr:MULTISPECIES: NAD-dependent epimerase/dehydratase family protein [unclassified Mycolicibacterium]MUL44353.1 NAD-dependent epimerase/dehydratase family protein [Mycolicibacterium sp. CBMA 360]MUL59671.1 NAD-dependent epimerase/dehydratase family protein [Mycolicibacterium sp. CBMA 335]MUL68514.1 NAD-dependent epimerase/dehydratase family protein [Mycolicibacterium sp. CBMA 311]MUL97167.1 NAD-dependent epimerase/dehydratase family protein [Mycolicibacterium sp. CBMA 230]MUM06341.1 dehydrogena